MSKLFNIDVNELKKVGGYYTAKEVYHQPKLWRETLDIINLNKEQISVFINEKLNKDSVRIILTGAGTSAYVGDIAAPYLSRILGVRVEAIATTDIVSNPEDFLKKDTPTILVSFARSGNSPESVATYDLAEQLVNYINQIIITCYIDGALAKKAQGNNNYLVILMPEESNDQSFAMTSSFSCMLLTTLIIFDMKNLNKNTVTIENIITNANKILETEVGEILNLVKLGCDRVVYLGSSALNGLSKEASLKNLELTSGKVNSTSESVLGFRHGPKSIVNEKTLVFVFVSNDEYTRKYDIDLLREIYNDKGNHKVVAITYNKDTEIDKIADKVFIANSEQHEVISDAFGALDFVLYAQMFALFYSLELGISPDNPRPDGTVNRVVKGVTIHQYDK
ncbi:MAG: SIS domain-containing protein [Clostridiaceae bacterium]|nr:SIS domain-containing protein [Clostridiaceae bacterium]